MNKFRYLRTFENFTLNSPQKQPSPNPGPNPTRPSTDPVPHPGKRPTDPNRRYKPAVDPKPKAETDVSVEELLGLVNLYMNDKQKNQLNSYYAKTDK